MFLNKFLKLSKTLKNGYLSSQSEKQSSLYYMQKRQIGFLLEWFIRVFNSVDTERVRLVGHECACAEWLLRNGASVRFKGHHSLLSDYNELIALEEIDPKILKIEEIYGRDAALSAVGFDHLIGCNHVKKITFIFCKHLTDSAIFKLSHVENTLEHLELTSCFGIRDKGLTSITNLRNLKTLILADLVGVQNKEECEAALRKALPQCKIDFKK